MQTIKARPRCRSLLIQWKLTPYTYDGVWDGHSANGRDGEQTWLSDGLRKEMRRMIGEGYWPDVRLGRGRIYPWQRGPGAGAVMAHGD